MKLVLQIVFTLSFITHIFAQGESANWIFGNGAKLTFNVDTGAVNSTTAAQNTINTQEGCSSISDSDGNLLFYTDGRTVWNANYQIMLNADYNNGLGLLGDPSSTSSGVIVPHPGDADLYYVFTVDEPHHNNAWAFPNQGPADINGNPLNTYEETYGDNQTIPENDDGFNNGFNYSVIDMSLNGGLGDVVSNEKNVHLITYNSNDNEQLAYKCSEKITAVAANDCESIWVITQFVDTFYAFKINANGINTNPVTSILDPFITLEGYRRNSIGYMKSSPDGTKIAICHIQNSNTPSDDYMSNDSGSLWLYDFNDETGIISNPTNLMNNVPFYGTEFSSNSKKLYASYNNIVMQFDLENNNNTTLVYTGNAANSKIFSMQLGLNGKIYIINSDNSSNALDVIETPNETGNNCNYNPGGQTIAANTGVRLGLPPFITSYLRTNFINIIDPLSSEIYNNLELCDQTQYTLIAEDIPGANYTWTHEGILLPEDDFDLIVSESGFYEVVIENIPDQCNTTLIGQANVSFFESPVVNNQPNDIIICDDNGDGVWSFDFSTQNEDIIGNQDSNTLSVHYYENLEDANNRENPIQGNYNNTSNPQEIFARIENVNNINCHNITSFFIRVFNTPVANTIPDIEHCDDASDGDDSNGQTTVNLSPINAIVLGNQSPNSYGVSYYTSQNNADSKIDPLPLSYYNNTPYHETIFVRIENLEHIDCYITSSFELIINPIPEAYDAILFQCDNDGINDAYTTFDLTQSHDALVGNLPNLITRFYPSLEDAENSSNEIDGNAFNNSSNPQTLFVQVINPTTNCFDISELELRVSVTSAHNATLEICDDDGTEDGLSSFNLTDANDTISAGAPGDVTINYYETYEDALLEENPLNTTYTNTTPYFQVIYARTENNNACYGINTLDLTIYELPPLEDDTVEVYCLNFFPEYITLTSGVIENLQDNYSYQWSNGATTSEIQVNEISTYNVTITNSFGCTKTRTITLVPSNIATITTIEVLDGTSNNTITVNVTGEGDYEYALNNISGPYQNSNTFENVNSGLHKVYVRDKNNCGTAEGNVSVIGFPKFFTPNGDNHNATWQVYGVNTPNQVKSKIYIFDRFGKLLATLDPRSAGWDGTYNGKSMPSNDYWFYVILQDGREFKGHFTLKR
ncbi:MAG: T9SS type B sorting domain-containing protein [Flavobacteriaceae bacterium]|nr:T9SS type B sorting domain-containing protein [Flavobacteriaceae bacterium]